MKRLILIDGNAILHRAFHALPPLTTSKGELVNAVFGFTSMLLKVRDELSPVFFAVSFDLPKPTFRQKIFKDYQIQRPQMADELVGQVEKVKKVVRALEIPIYAKQGYEADDVIGTLAKQAGGKRDLEIIIVTGDRDLLQLVDERTKVYMLIKGISEATLYNKEKVKEKFGLEPFQLVDYKALIGDPSDNYLGVEGIGPKTATHLLQRYVTLKQIYKEIDNLELGIREKLEKGKKDAELSQRLATIITDVPVKLDLERCAIGEFTKPEAIKLLEELEFKSLIRRLKKENSTSAKATAGKQEKKDNDNGQMGLF